MAASKRSNLGSLVPTPAKDAGGGPIVDSNGTPRISPDVRRGTLSVPSRATGKTFMFNPNEIDDSKGINWGTLDVPGSSHPVHQFGSGGERLISFTLYLDGDRGRFGREALVPGELAHDTNSLSISDEVNWYRSLIYPSNYGYQYATVAPYVVLFSFGEFYQSVPCLVKKADIKFSYWVPNAKRGGRLMPVRATIPMILTEITDKSQTSADILNLTSF